MSKGHTIQHLECEKPAEARITFDSGQCINYILWEYRRLAGYYRFIHGKENKNCQLGIGFVVH
jgi:hypothetical protein